MTERYSEQPATGADYEARRVSLRWPGDGLDGGYGRPHDVEPLASRLERARRVQSCRDLSWQMLADLHGAGWAVSVEYAVWVKGIQVDFLVFTWKGAFLIWSIDERWTYRQAALVMPARAQIQRELEGWPGQVEAIFHSPREGTGWARRVAVDEQTGEPVEIVTAGGRLDEVLRDWRPAGGVGLDPEWLHWLSGASQPRWWRSGEGRYQPPQPPAHDRL